MPNLWARVPLGEIAREVRDRLDPANEPNLPYVGLADVEPRQRRIPAYGVLDDVSSSKTRFRPGDILFGKLRPYLHKVAQADREGGASTDILVVRPRNGLEPDFLYWRLTSDAVIEHAERHSAGTKMPRTSWARLAEFEVPLPPLPEQKKIAAILSRVDDAIATTRKVIEQTKRVKKGLRQTLMTRGIGHTRFKNTEIGEIPETWTVQPLQDLLESRTYGISAALSPEPVGTPILRMGNLKDGRLDLSALKYADISKLDTNRSMVRPGDILFNRTNSIDLVGRSAIVETDRDLGYASYLIRLRPKASVDPRWLVSFMNSWHGQRIIKKLAKRSVSQANINPTALGRSLFPVPPAEEQQRIANVLYALRAGVDRAAASIEALASLKQGLLQDLLTGRVRVQPD